ncbi:MAG: Nif3-like dinuclear metal center hexameric protein [Oscillospiraceae bacterium]|nr:Nif3-like dinuclear metal center hexameric protein [Oscillospiraceae bacterium]
MTTVQDIYNYIDSIIPFKTQEGWDNSGLLAGDPDMTVHRIITALDITNEVIGEAVSENAELIISHHPVIFTPLRAVMADSVVGRLLTHEISAICTHTPFDMSPLGMNKGLYELLKEPLGLCDEGTPLEETGEGLSIGRIYELKATLSPEEAAKKAKTALGCQTVRFSRGGEIRKIAVSSGSGGSFVSLAMKKGADALISGDFKHDAFVDSGNEGFTIIDCGHYHTERIFSGIMAELLSKRFPEIKISAAKSSVDPSEYVL